MAQFPYGFYTWAVQGDAFILYDMYVPAEQRLKGHAWALFNDAKRLAKAYDKNVIISFSEEAGTKQELGQAALKAADFIMAYKTPVDTIWIRGTN